MTGFDLNKEEIRLWLRGVILRDELALISVLVSAKNEAKALLVVQDFLSQLPKDSAGLAGRGGWVARPSKPVEGRHRQGKIAVLEILAGGEDVADAVEDATAEVFEFFVHRGLGGVTWSNGVEQ